MGEKGRACVTKRRLQLRRVTSCYVALPPFSVCSVLARSLPKETVRSVHVAPCYFGHVLSEDAEKREAGKLGSCGVEPSYCFAPRRL